MCSKKVLTHVLTHVFILLLMNTRCIEEKRTCHVARIHTRTLSAESLRRRRRVAGWSRPRRGDEILESRRVDERERQVLAVNKLSDLGVQLLAVGGVEREPEGERARTRERGIFKGSHGERGSEIVRGRGEKWT